MIDIKSYGSTSKGNSYIISDGESSLMLEAGINPDRMKGVDWSKVQGCLISHLHGDHSKYAKRVIETTGFDVFANADTIQFLNTSIYRSKEIKGLEEFKIGNWNIMPFPLKHDIDIATLGFFIESKDGDRLLFATDTYYIPFQFPDITHLMIECNYSKDILNKNVESGLIQPFRYKRLLRSHFELGNVKKFISSNDMTKLEEVWLLHLSNQNADGDRFKKEIQAITGKPVYIA